MLFQIARDELGTRWEKIPTDTDILVTCFLSAIILSAKNTDTKAMQCTKVSILRGRSPQNGTVISGGCQIKVTSF